MARYIWVHPHRFACLTVAIAEQNEKVTQVPILQPLSEQLLLVQEHYWTPSPGKGFLFWEEKPLADQERWLGTHCQTGLPPRFRKLVSQKDLCSFFQSSTSRVCFSPLFFNRSLPHFSQENHHNRDGVSALCCLPYCSPTPRIYPSDTPVQVLLFFPAVVKSVQEQAHNKLWFTPLSYVRPPHTTPPPRKRSQVSRTFVKMKVSWF